MRGETAKEEIMAVKFVALLFTFVGILSAQEAKDRPNIVKPIEVRIVQPTGYIEYELRCPVHYEMLHLKAVIQTVGGFKPSWEVLSKDDLEDEIVLEDTPDLYLCWNDKLALPSWVGAQG
jgi:hypothetical protein